MPRYRKKAIIVTAEVADMPQYITTLEGVSTVNKGDYIVTGVENEIWAVKPEWFHGAYTHLRGNHYQRKAQVLTAVCIHEPETVTAPTGPIKGDPGDYKITGTKGEHWFVKPDIFEQTYDPVSPGTHKKEDKQMLKSMHDITFVKALPTDDIPVINDIQKSINQIGLDAMMKYLPKGMRLNPCDLHGAFLSHYTTKEPLCPLCIKADGGNGTTATDVEHYIDLRDGVNPLTDHDGF